MSRSSATSARTSPDRFGRLLRLAGAVLLVALLVAGPAGCEPPPVPTTQPDASADAGATTQPEQPSPAVTAPQPTMPEQPTMPPSPPVVEPVQPEPAPPPAAGPGGDLSALGAPAGAKIEYKMPGTGSPPADGSADARQRAAVQAAIFIAIYNVTNELNDVSRKDRIEDGYVESDHFRYNDGLEVKSETTVVRGLVTRFDVWLIVPAGDGPGQNRFEVQVRNFTLVNPPLTQEQLDRLFRKAGGHLVVMGVTGPDDRGLYTAQVGLVRKVNRPIAAPSQSPPAPTTAPEE
ncbi:MAG: hypothetical protein BIFFINMI_01937 [Phycisphaerae bacterium]|nr:hypothetical protein [Phycisphaerae bacterium]